MMRIFIQSILSTSCKLLVCILLSSSIYLPVCYAGVFEVGIGWYGASSTLESDASNNFGSTAEKLETSAFDFSYKNFDIGVNYILKSGIGFGGEFAFFNREAVSFNANNEANNNPSPSVGKKSLSAPWIVYSQNSSKDLELDGSGDRLDLTQSQYKGFTNIERTRFSDAYDFFVNTSVLDVSKLSDNTKYNEVQLGYIVNKYSNQFYSLNANYNFVISMVATFAEIAFGIAPTNVNITDIFYTASGSANVNKDGSTTTEYLYLVDTGMNKTLESNNLAYRLGGGFKVNWEYCSPVVYVGYFHAFSKKIKQNSDNQYIPAINQFSNQSPSSIDIGYSDLLMKVGVNFYF